MIRRFEGEYAFLSKLYPSPITFGELFNPTAEDLYQALKALHAAEHEMIRLAATPGKAKRLSRKISVGADWDERQQELMLAVARIIFQQNPALSTRLLDSADEELVEGNIRHDNFWGDCSSPDCMSVPGQNLMGEILEQVRRELAAPVVPKIDEATMERSPGGRACPGLAQAAEFKLP